MVFKLKRLDAHISREKKHAGRQVTAIQIERYLRIDILPLLGDQLLGSITRSDVLAVQRQIEQRGAFSIAKKVRTWLDEIFNYAVALDKIDLNPAASLHQLAEPYRDHINPCLDLEDIPEFLAKLSIYSGTQQIRLGLRLLLLTGIRIADLRFAERHHMDLEQALWYVSSPHREQHRQENFKKNHSQPIYVIPLSLQAQQIIHTLCACAHPHQRYLLSHRLDPQQAISENTLNLALKRLGFGDRLTSQGMRTTFFNALQALGYKVDHINIQMHHFNREEIRRTYNHAQYLNQRRKMMQEWADLLDLWEEEGKEKLVLNSKSEKTVKLK